MGTDGARIGASGFYSEVQPGDFRRLFNDTVKTDWFEVRGSLAPVQPQKSSLTLKSHREERVRVGIVDRQTEDPAMAMLSRLLLIGLLASPLAAYAQSGGGGGGGGAGGGGTGGGASSGGASAGTTATGAASGPTAGSPSAAGTPGAGSAGAGSQAVSGVPNGPANLGGNNNSGNDPSGAGNANKVPTAPGTNSVGTANATGGSSNSNSSTGTGSQTTGSALNRPGGQSGGRIDGTVTQGPEMPGDAAIRAEDQVVDKKIKSICKGC